MPVDGGLRRRMQLVRGLQWLWAAQGDPFATLLRGHPQDVTEAEARLRHGDPIRRDDTGTWAVARHGTAAAILAHPAFEAHVADWRPTGTRAMPLIDHDLSLRTETRAALIRLTDPIVGQDALARRHSRLRSTCERTVAAYQRELDLASLAAQVSIEVMADLLALPTTDQLADLTPDAGLVMDSLLCPQGIEPTRRMLVAVAGLRAMFGDAEFVLAVIGVRICTDLLLNALRELLARPAAWADVIAAPESAAKVVDETLRHSPPVRMQFMRARTDATIDGREIAAGDQVVVLLGAANRDPEVFTEPDRFDPTRTGAPALLPRWPAELVLPLARTQAELAIASLATRCPGLALSGTAVRRPKAPVTGGLLRLPAVIAERSRP